MIRLIEMSIVRFFYFSIEKISSHIFLCKCFQVAFLENIFLHFLFLFSIQSRQISRIHNHTKCISFGWLASDQSSILAIYFFSQVVLGFFFSITSFVVGGIFSNLLGLEVGGTLMVGGGNHLEVPVQHNHLHLFHKRQYCIPIR